MRLNTIYNEDCLEGMKRISDGSVDLTVTSPPYDSLRSYNGNNEAWNEDVWKEVIKELHRVTAEGGVVVWVVGDSTVNGSETGTSFKQALHFKDVGFRLHDTMIYRKNNPMPLNHNRYEQEFEYMFIFSKGKPKTFNPIKVPCKTAGQKYDYSKRKSASNKEINSAGRSREEIKATKNDKIKGNVWSYHVGINQSTKDRIAFRHPAIFPEKLAEDHLISWSNENDIVLDPFMGSGTTAIACLNTNRQYIGFELDETYHRLSLERIENHKQQ